MFQRLQALPFIIGVVAGIVGILMIKPDKTVNIKSPTPENAEKTIYKDKNKVCYKFKTTKVDCDKSEEKLAQYPLAT